MIEYSVRYILRYIDMQDRYAHNRFNDLLPSCGSRNAAASPATQRFGLAWNLSSTRYPPLLPSTYSIDRLKVS